MLNISNGRSRSSRQARQEEPVPVPPARKPPDKSGQIPLRQAQYRTKLRPIQIYHYRVNFLSVHLIRRILGRECPAYRNTLIGPDTQVGLFRIDGDELPKGVVEAAYIPDVWMRPVGRNRFKAYGSALGFRTINKNKENIIEWCCFNDEIEDSVLNKWTFDQSTRVVHVQDNFHKDDPKLLFNKVATLDKDPFGDKPKQGKTHAYQEHIDWHESLSKADLRPLKLKINWPSYPVEYMAHVAQRRQAEEVQDEGHQEEDDQEEYEEAEEGYNGDDNDSDDEGREENKN
jgi:hypothetical protein